MSRISPKTTADRFLHTFIGCHPDIDGNITLEPTNHFKNWTFSELDDDNDPIGLEVGLPEDPDGFWVFCSKKDEGPETMAAQHTELIDLDENSWLIEEPPVEGHAPATSTNASQLIARPPLPKISAKARDKTGLAAGTYTVAYTWVKGKKHTELSPGISVTIGNGQFLRVALPTSPPEGVTGIGIWMSRSGFGGLRLQKVVSVKHSRPTSTLIKSFKNGRKGSDGNETKKRRPRRPRLRRVRGRRKGRAGQYQANQREIDDETGREGDASNDSNVLNISSNEANRNVHLLVDDVNRGRSRKRNTSHRVYIRRNGQERVFNNRTEGSSSRPLSSRRSRRPMTSGRFEEEPTRGERGVLSSTSSTSYGVGREQEVIEPPSSPLDEAGTFGEGPIYISAGKYWVGIAYGVRGEETMVTEPQRIEITSTQVIKVDFPDPIDFFSNSQWLDLDRDGKPDGWTFTGIAATATEGAASVSEDGDLVLNTLGQKTPSLGHITPEVSQTVDVNKNKFYTVGGALSASISAGAVEVVLLELSDTNTTLATHMIRRIVGSGAIEFEMNFGKDEIKDFNAATKSVKFLVRFAGVTEGGPTTEPRNATMSISELYFHNHKGRVRRRNKPEKGDAKHSNPNPENHKRHSKKHTKGIELPPAKSRKPPSVAPLAQANFEDGGVIPEGFSLYTLSATAPGLVYENSTTTPPSGLRSFRVDKNDSINRKAFLYKSFGTTRSLLGVHATVRVTQRSNDDDMALLSISHALSESQTYILCAIYLDNSGNLELRYYNYAGSQYITTLATGVASGSLLDLELLARGAGTTAGLITVGWGVNKERTFRSPIGVNWGTTPKYANVAQIGPHHYDDPKVQYELFYDNVVITEYGDTLSNPGVPPTLEPIPIPDRPYQTPVTIEDVSFDGGALPTTNWTATTPSPTVITTAPLMDGTHYMRCADDDAASFEQVYLTRTISPTRAKVGFRAKVRVTTRPTSGAVALMGVRAADGTPMATVYIDSAGDVWVQSTKASGATTTAVKIWAGVTNGTSMVLEMVVGGAGTTAGLTEVWLEKGTTTGGIMARQLMHQETAIDWSTKLIGQLRAGGFTMGTTPAVTSLYTFDYDAIKITEAGEVLLVETASDGTPIYQINVYFHPDQPVRDDLYVRGLRLAVRPGEQYTCAIQARHAGVVNKAYPYFFSAYDLEGNEYPLGSLYGDDGCIGTGPWNDLSRTFTIPAGCYEIRMDSRSIGQGEFTCQALAVTRGLQAIREVTYPATGQFKVSLDTRPPKQHLASRPKNIWLRLDCMVNEEETTAGSTSSSIRYGSANTDFIPEFWTTDPNAVEQRNWAHFEVTLNADPSLKASPIVLSDEPGVETLTRNGNTQVAVLLRENMSEFPGGVYLDNLHFPRELSEWDQWKPRGHLRRHRRYAPVGSMAGFTINAFTEEAMREIEETALSEEFVVEARDRRFTIKFSEPIEFEVKTKTAKKVNGEWHMWGSASVAPVEVTEIGEVPETTIGLSL